MKSIVYFVILSALIFTPSSIFSIKPKSPVISKNIIYADAAGLSSIGHYYSLNYERIIGKRFSVRVGLGYSESIVNLHVLDVFGQGSGGDGFEQGFVGMINMFTEGSSKFNIGLGVSLMYSEKEQIVSGNMVADNPRSGWKYSPAINISYRYLPADGGIFLGLGVTAAYLTGGINLSLGYIF